MNRVFRSVIVIGAVAFVFCGFTIGSSQAQIKIGFQAPVTGFAATDGKSAQIAAEMAVDDINAKGGVLGQKLQLVSYDDQAKADQAIFTANKLIGDDKVKLAIRAAIPLPAGRRRPSSRRLELSSSLLTGYTPTSPARAIIASAWCCSDRRKAVQEQRLLARRLASSGSPSSAWIMITARQRWRGFSAPPTSSASRSSISTAIRCRTGSWLDCGEREARQSRRDLRHRLFLYRAPLVAQLRAAGVKAPVIGSQAFDSRKFMEIAGPAANGVYVVDGFDRTRNDAALKSFFTGFQKRAGYPPEAVAAETYSSFIILADAIKRARSTDPAKVRDALAATKNAPLLIGTLVGFNQLQRPSRGHLATSLRTMSSCQYALMTT